MKNNKFELILFDLGGVLIELTGVPVMLRWMGDKITTDQLWEKWLTSPSVRSFESGRCGSNQFANSIVNEFQLPVTPEQFIQEFTYWPKRLFPGVTDLLEQLRSSYKLSTLSNTNELHWNRFCTEFKIKDLFDHHFLSFKIGLIKPDADIFHHVIKSIGCSPERILFFDDNQLNIDAAQKVGMTAHRVSGIDELSDRIEGLDLLPTK